MSEWTYEQVAARLRGRSIAVVANSPVLMESHTGDEIDRHDLVLRMNAAIPDSSHQRSAGQRTDVLAVGTLKLLELALSKGAKPSQVWWMKLTEMGASQLDLLRSRRSGYPPFDLWCWPQDMEDRVHERVGAPPSTGIRILDFLQHYCEPGEISVFGFTCFGVVDDPRRRSTSWYRPRRPFSAPHQGHREMVAFQMMGFESKGAGWWHRSR